MPPPKHVAVIGARRKTQGTGEYIAAAFARQNHRIQAILGTSQDSLDKALEALRKQGMNPHGYLSTDPLFDRENIDIVAIATPPRYHLEYILKSLQYKCHVFCEKPLLVPSDRLQFQSVIELTDDILKRFNQNGLYLHLNTQWIYTLPAFRKLYPDVSLTQSDIQSFSMELCPQSSHTDMIIDAAPHMLSMLYALLGSGELNDCRSTLTPKHIDMTFNYAHQNGETTVTLHLDQCLTQPKPAAYSINGCRVERHVNMKDYALSFHNGTGEIAIEDPLDLSVKHCVEAIAEQSPCDPAILDGVRHLYQLTETVENTHAKNSL